MLFESAVRSNPQLIPYGIMNPSSEAPLTAPSIAQLRA